MGLLFWGSLTSCPKKSRRAAPVVITACQPRTEGPPRKHLPSEDRVGWGNRATATMGTRLVWIRKLWVAGRRTDFREAFCHGGHAGLMNHHSGPWKMRLPLVNICTFGSKNIILLLMQFSQCLWLKYTAQPFLKVTYTPPLKQRKAKQFSKNKILFCQKKGKKNSKTHVKSMEF